MTGKTLGPATTMTGSATTAASLIMVAARPRSRQEAWTLRSLNRMTARRLPGVPVVTSYLQSPEDSVTDALARATGPSVVVPMYLSSSRRVVRDIAMATALSPFSVQLAAALGPDPLVAEAMTMRLLSGGARAQDAVVVAAPAAGDPDEQVDVYRAARMLRARWGGRPVRVSFGVEGPSGVEQVVWETRRQGAPRVAVAPYLLAGSRQTAHLCGSAIQVGATSVAAELGPQPLVVELIVRRYLSAVELGRRRSVAA